jgi:putative hydrolase of the HAD superfamily
MGAQRFRPGALILDFDGTIVDTETPWYRAWQAVYAGFGAELPAALWARTVGTAGGAFDPVAHLEAQLGRPVDRAAVEAEFRRRGLALQARQGLRPGVRELLEEARAAALPVGLASNSPRAWVTGYLERFGLGGHFHAVCTGDEVVRLKPDPELYLLALRRLGVPAAAAVAVEDSPSGAAAALAAGLRCVVVPNAFTRVLRFPEGARLLPTLRGVRLAALG